MNYRKHLLEPHFTDICNGTKTVEGRPANGSFGTMNIGDIIVFYNDQIPNQIRECKVKITGISHHQSFITMLKSQSLKRVLPGINTFDEGLQIYKDLYPQMFEKGSLTQILTTPKVLGISLAILH